MGELEKINQLIKSLLDNTLRGSIIWSHAKHIVSVDPGYTYKSISFDAKTSFEITFDLTEDLRSIKNYTNKISIRDNRFDEKFEIIRGDALLMNKLQNIIFNLFIKDKLICDKKERYLNTIDEITNGMSIDVVRNDRINVIIKDGDTE